MPHGVGLNLLRQLSLRIQQRNRGHLQKVVPRTARKVLLIVPQDTRYCSL